MELYDVFKSEGGYRVCLGLWGNNPIIAKCPWYGTEKQVLYMAMYYKFKNQAKGFVASKGDPDICESPYVAIINVYKEDSYEPEQKIYGYNSLDGAKGRVVSEMMKLGYSKEFILRHRKDLQPSEKCK